MQLVVDVGNTETVVGLVEGRTDRRYFRQLSRALPAGVQVRVGRREFLPGLLAELGLGAALRVGGPFLVGAEVSAGWTHLFRQPVPGCATECADERLDLRRAGEGDGLTLRLHLWGGVSF